MIVLENDQVRLELGEANGTVRGLRDKKRDLAFIADGGAEGAVPFRLERDGGADGAFASFAWELAQTEAGAQQAKLAWTTEDGVAVRAEILLAPGEGELVFRCAADNGSGERLLSLEYPVLPGIGTLTEGGADDIVAHPFATGVKVRNPMANFAADGPGLRYMPYPESFSGASMQFFAYYGENRGGLYFAADDGDGRPKWLNFFKGAGGLLEASFIHGCEDMGPGKGIAPPYAARVALLAGEGWEEAADRYKGWAHAQAWCAAGKLADRPAGDGGDWLFKDMGAATFGINAGSDRTAWLRAYRDALGTPIFHVLGPDWTNAPQTFYKGVPGGFDDWFPTRFNEANLACMKAFGDKFAPFEFDYLYRFEGADGELGRAAAQKFPDAKKSIDAYRFPFLCPAHPYAHEFHVRRDAELQRANDVDAIYYDISANNILKICMDDSHGHPVGAGRLIEEAYRRNYADTKRAMREAAGRYVPMGTEMMNETMLGLIDYYQARAGGQPAAPLELWPLRELLKTGEAELAPMFAYVYHEYGILRMDGWGKLTEEIGELFYFTVARTYLWGGLYELNYEYSPMEALDGRENAPEEHYYPFEPRGYAFSPSRAAYLGAYAKLRVGEANKYWAYGRMLRPLAYECARVRLDWFHYNHGKESPEYNDAGTLEVEAVVHAAWAHKDGSAALFFANATGEEQTVRTRIDAGSLGLDLDIGASVEVRLFGAPAQAGGVRLDIGDAGDAEFKIPARCAAMIELS
ncbi:hypothetical protein I8J29_12320 [Paenibacillus sp. MWE-103]|uniref:DUF6259 domain-containing protein n=1 Tax=Paenibacillus artemisiicola TaxID=1172618 RepID=A0ABS3WA45_9BACL|nr:DUF6259 domain-containing protein [Paenibacillus artemisiicola]MBO7744985.1 hypothetical protein [Paenibacillus artemisiicola]